VRLRQPGEGDASEGAAQGLVDHAPVRADVAAGFERACSTHEVSAIGPSTASTMSASVIAAAGRASLSPPPAPRTDRSRPARDSRLTSFCTVGTGSPVSSARSAAETRAEPQWRAAAHIVTTA
jgi:hypothetical protein